MTSTFFESFPTAAGEVFVSPLVVLKDERRTRFAAEDFTITNSTDYVFADYLPAVPPMLANREFEMKLALSKAPVEKPEPDLNRIGDKSLAHASS